MIENDLRGKESWEEVDKKIFFQLGQSRYMFSEEEVFNLGHKEESMLTSVVVIRSSSQRQRNECQLLM